MATIEAACALNTHIMATPRTLVLALQHKPTVPNTIYTVDIIPWQPNRGAVTTRVELDVVRLSR